MPTNRSLRRGRSPAVRVAAAAAGIAATAIAVAVMAGVAAAAMPAAEHATAGSSVFEDLTLRVSVGSGGGEGNEYSSGPAASADGRIVSFFSRADNLVARDTNGRVKDVFLRDPARGTTILASKDSRDQQCHCQSRYSSLSRDGSLVAFHSLDRGSGSLVPVDANAMWDVFVRDVAGGTTELVSVSLDGDAGNGDSSVLGAGRTADAPSISADGRFVAFASYATDLVEGDTNNVSDVFVRDRVAGTTERVSVGPGGAEADGESFYSGNAAISGDGRYVAFWSRATNLVAANEGGAGWAIFVHDRETAVTDLVARASPGPYYYNQTGPAISGGGRYVAFSSTSGNLVPSDTNGEYDVFVYDRVTGIGERASVDSRGWQGGCGEVTCAGEGASNPALSADGRYVAFYSDFTNLVPGDANGWEDAFRHDRLSGETIRVSVSSAGAEGDWWSGRYGPPAVIDGGAVALDSQATNLVRGDHNSQWDVFVHLDR